MGPPRADFVFLFEDKRVDLGKSIFGIFKRVNILEYKNPLDDLNERIVRKACAYANFYIAANEQTPVDQVTVSIFRSEKNRKMFKEWEEDGRIVADAAPGIYHVKGFTVPFQIIITNELQGEEYAAYRALSNRAKRSDVDRLMQGFKGEKDEAIKECFQTMIKLIMEKNPKLRDMIRRNPRMSEDTRKFFYEICQIDIEEEKKAAAEEATKTAEAAAEAAAVQRNIEIAQKMITGNKLTYEEIADYSNLPLQKVLELAGEKSA